MKALHIFGDSKYGGAAKNMIHLAKSLNSNGWDVRILTSDPVFQNAAREARIGYVGLDCIWREIRPLRDLLGLWRVWRFLRAGGFTVVHTHTTKAGFIGRIAARLAGVPIILHTVHGFAFHERSSRVKIGFYTLLETVAARCCHRIVTVSQFHRSWALELGIAPAEKLEAIPNGVPNLRAAGASRGEIRTGLSLTEDDFLVFTPGRLAPEKGLETLLAALALARNRVSRPVCLALAGVGPLRSALERQTRRLGLTDHVRFLGFRSDIAELLRGADLVVLPSVREGLSIALLEAMSAGRAILATSIGSNREALGDSHRAAILIQSEDPRALAEGMVLLAENPALRQRLGAEARRRWEQAYTIERSLLAYRESYRNLLERHCPERGEERHGKTLREGIEFR